MKIVWENNINTVSFTFLIMGDVFIYDDMLFMKIETSFNDTNSKTYNAVRLVDGKLINFVNEHVILIDGKFIVDSNKTLDN